MNRTAMTAALAGVVFAVGCASDNTRESRSVGMDDPRRAHEETVGAVGVEQTIRIEGLGSADLATARGGPAQGMRDDRLRPYALFEGPLPTTFAMTEEGQLFIAFPRWGRPVEATVATVSDGKLVAFPSAEMNRFDTERPQKYDLRTHIVSAQAVVTDAEDRVWIVDTGSIQMGPPIKGGPKLWAYDAESAERVMAIDFKPVAEGGVIKPKTYLNDARFDLTRGENGFAYLTDSGEGGIIVVDLGSGESWRQLDGHDSVRAKTELEMTVEGEPFKREGKTPAIHSDGIALSPDGAALYYTPLTGRDVFAVPTEALRDRETDAAPRVHKIASKPSGNDGIWCDVDGRIYTTDFEDNAIRRITPKGSGEAGVEVVVQDERLLWPDCVIVHDGTLYVTSNQLHRQPNMQGGLEEPFVIFEYPLGGE